jgi:hypothetical protein
MKPTPLLAAVDAWLFLPMAIAVFFLVTLLFQWLWNTTMPQVFGLRPITFWQAFRLLLMASFLFGSGSIIKRNV